MKSILSMSCNVASRDLVLWIEKLDGSVVMVRLPERIHRHAFW